MRRLFWCKLFLAAALAAPPSVQALQFEAVVSAGWGKRFADTFDKRWANLRPDSDSSSLQEAVYTKLETLRDLPSGQILFLVSPFYQHYFGLGIGYFGVFSDVKQAYQLNGTSYEWGLNLSGYVPEIHYRYYTSGESRSLYIAATLGLVLGRMDLSMTKSGDTTKVTFDRIRGPLFEGAVGYVFGGFKKLKFFAQVGIETQRLDEFEGYFTENNERQTFKLKYDKTYLVPVSPSAEQQLSGFENAVVWNTQLKINFGLIYRFN